jgi:magnesium transporter
MRRRAAILEKLEPQRAAEILSGLSADERTDVIQKMGHHPRHLIVPRITVEERKELEGLLQYPAHTAGGIMTTEFVQLNQKMSVADALKHIRAVAREKESIYACYVMTPAPDNCWGRSRCATW